MKKCQIRKLTFTTKRKECFLQTDTPEIIPGNGKQTGFSRTDVKNLAELSLDMKKDVSSSMNSSAEDSATESKQFCSKSDATTNGTKENESV